MKIGFIKKEGNVKKKLSIKEVIICLSLIFFVFIVWDVNFGGPTDAEKILTFNQKRVIESRVSDFEFILSKAKKANLYKFIKPDKLSVYVDVKVWSSIDIKTKTEFGKMAATYMCLKFNKSENVYIRDYLNNKEIGFYSNDMAKTYKGDLYK